MPPIDSPGHTVTCPLPEVLAAYRAGKLTPAEMKRLQFVTCADLLNAL